VLSRQTAAGRANITTTIKVDFAVKASYRPDNPLYTAELLVARYGNAAESQAVREMDECQASGDGDCYSAWGRNCDAVIDLQAQRAGLGTV
jgi:hypothetical protein